MKNERGFTLLEVLVATAIMAIAVTGLLTSLNTSLRNASRVTNVDRAALLARQKMDELLVAPKLPKNTVIEGGWDPALTGALPAGWRARLGDFEKPIGAGPGTEMLQRIDLEVWWDNNGNHQSFQLIAYKIGKILPEDVAP
jgi:general secretion pathway protein I